MSRVASAGRAAWYLLPGALTVYLGFSAGGFFPDTTGFVAGALAVGLALRLTLAERPFAGLTPPLAIAAGALALYSVWVLISSSWSDAPYRALIEFDKALLYTLALVLFGSVPRTRDSLQWAVRGLVLGMLVVCVAGLLTRIAPDVVSVDPKLARDRISYPLTYWNALGLVAAIGATLSFHLASSLREPWPVRAFGAAAIPAFALTLFFTFSRGGIGVAVIGLAAYALLARPRGLPGALVAAGPATAYALTVAYGADVLASTDPRGPGGDDEARDVQAALIISTLAAAGLRAAWIPIDARLDALRLPDRARGPVLAGGAAALVVAVVAVALALDAPGYVERQYDRFVEGTTLATTGDARERLFDPANNRRLDHWDVAVDAWAEQRLRGHGAGTYAVLWAQDRPASFEVLDAHSLYVEVMAELGLVGLVLLATGLLALFTGLALRMRGSDRAVAAALLAAGLAWAVRAGIDWDWEMPAVSLWLFAVGGSALAARAGPAEAGSGPPRTVRIVAALALLFLAITPLQVARSQVRLEDSLEAFQRGDCRTASDAALSSLDALSIRPEPWELLGYCDVRAGQSRLAVRALENAVERDPDNWETHYGLALVRGVAGLDPRREAALARRLNPLETLTRRAVRLFRTDSRRVWIRRARTAELNVPLMSETD